jgi:hypothetical protein
MSESRSKRKAKRRKRFTAVAVAVVGLTAASGAIASTQPFSTDNPFESSIPSAVNGSGGINGIDVGEPTVGDIFSFPGRTDGGLPSIPGGIPESIEDVFGGSSGPVPSIFSDILNGNIGGILESVMGVLTRENEIFTEISKVVLGDGWEGIEGGNQESPPDPYKVRLPQEEQDEETGILTRSPIVVRRDKANQYDQELGRAMAAPMLAEAGQEWLEANITTSSDMMQAGLGSTQSAINKATEATAATSTQEIVRRSAEISGFAATMQMQEMQQNAMLGESLWHLQRLESAQLQLAANASEAADEQNRRDRANRTAGLSSAALQPLIIPVRGDAENTAESTAPAAPELFATP